MSFLDYIELLFVLRMLKLAFGIFMGNKLANVAQLPLASVDCCCLMFIQWGYNLVMRGGERRLEWQRF